VNQIIREIETDELRADPGPARDRFFCASTMVKRRLRLARNSAARLSLQVAYGAAFAGGMPEYLNTSILAEQFRIHE
jgi:hypothetical protein